MASTAVSKKIAEPEDVAQCNVIGGSVPPALAWTEFEMPPIGTPAEIQLCPWFAGWANLRGFKTFKDASVSAWLARFAIPASFELGVFTEVDVYSLLDKVLLHEMTHLFVTHHSTDVRAQSQRPFCIPLFLSGFLALIFKRTA